VGQVESVQAKAVSTTAQQKQDQCTKPAQEERAITACIQNINTLLGAAHGYVILASYLLK